jgi:transcriptional regulator of acetoin/glycerol metabolism
MLKDQPIQTESNRGSRKRSRTGTEKVGDSWRRSVSKYRVDPNDLAPPNLLTEGEIRRCRESLETIIDLARDEVDRLYAIVKEEGWVVLF